MEMSPIRFLALISAVILLGGCAPGESPYSQNMTLLTGGTKKTWVTVDFQSPMAGEGINCRADDILTLELFNPQFKLPVFTLEDNVSRCYNTDPFLVSAGGWRLNNQQTRLILSEQKNGVKSNDIYDILELTENRMVLRHRNENFTNLVVFYETITYESR